MYEKNSWLLNLVELSCSDIKIPAIFESSIYRCFVYQYSKNRMLLNNLSISGNEIIITDNDGKKINTFTEGDIIFECGFLYSTVVLYNDFVEFQSTFNREKLLECFLHLLKSLISLNKSSDCVIYIKSDIKILDPFSCEYISLDNIFIKNDIIYCDLSNDYVVNINDLSTRDISKLYYDICDF